jgi:methylmalonyl-CoA mutase C-terminal domain/subunit
MVFGGGIIPEKDIPLLRKAGVREIFTPGTPTSKIVEFIKSEIGF